MKLVSWNVNSIRARINLLLNLLDTENPDIVLLQEIKCKKQDFPFSLIEDLNYNIAISGQSGYNGVAILSKFPIDEIKTDFIDNPCLDDARFIETTLNTNLGYIRLICVYVPNGGEINSEKFYIKLNFLQALNQYFLLNKSFDELMIIGGDFNVAPENIDVYNPVELSSSIGFSIQERQKMRALLNSGFFDLFRLCHSNIQEFSWWDYRNKNFYYNHGMRLDFILSTANVTKFVQDCYISTKIRAQDKTSDHAPVILLLK